MNGSNSPLGLKTFAVILLIVINIGIQVGAPSSPPVSGDVTIRPPNLWTPVSLVDATEIPLQHSVDLKYTLQEGRQYHAFLVGNWTETSSQTDYDIYVNGPGGPYRFTEAQGLPEQVFNDGKEQFFTPTASGEYTFNIHNDEGDSGGENPAVFMLIEHIDTDRVYTADLKGRTTVSGSYTTYNTYAVEFTTYSGFTVYVDTPDDLDIFEVRLYPMAGGSAGLDINGVPTPTGAMVLGNVTGNYGGYNTNILGFKWPELTVSGFTYGEKVTLYGNGGGVPTTYFLVLIAEYSKTSALSSVPFSIKTSTVEPTLSLNGTMGDVFTGETKKVSAIISSPYALKSVWMNFTVNGDPGELVEYFSKVGQLYEGEMPAFATKDVVDWSIFAVDEMGNVGRIDSSFTVRARTETSCLLSTGSVQAGETVEALGHTSVPGANVTLDFTTGSFKDSIRVKAGATGSYQYSYLPKQPGVWSVQASYDGNDVSHPSKSPPASFTMTPLPTTISVTLDPQVIKVNQELRLSGTTSPAMAGLMVDVTLASGGNVTTETLTTKADGSFSLVTPLVEGEWDVVAQVRGNWKFASSSSGIVKATVLPLTIVDQAMIAAAMAASPPYVYVVLLASAIVIALVVRWRVPDIASKLPKPVQALLARLPTRGGGRAKKADNGGKGRYRRQGEEE
ncbi:MAG: hypothetical protein Q8O47_09410 [Candidatus Bathyarchaeota archaeon]|nr:hypothetical protein [Candidatus Bathyarchaeota archaeon]